MSRCEDYPCCGCGPDGCIDFDKTVECADCGKTYHPDPQTGVYCYVCLSKPKYVPPKITKVVAGDKCAECGATDLRDDETGWFGKRVSGTPYCDDCADEVIAGEREAFELECQI